MHLALEVTKKQQAFLDATATEVLYGGAAGGGKSFGQLVDALLYALRYPGSKQLMLRRTYPELDKTLIRTALELYPRGVFTYSASARCGRFANGSLIDFGYCEDERDVLRYQGGEWDVIRFDELTHFTEYQYLFLLSRLRGANAYPKQMKCSTNPGGIGHAWVKSRFIDVGEAGEVISVPLGAGRQITRQYIKAVVFDNVFLMRSDPDYVHRLQALPQKQRSALLDGDWNVFEGTRFTSFDERVHVCEPFDLPQGWRRYRAIDYGLDRLSCHWFAIDSERNVYCYREVSIPNLIISEACRVIREMTHEEIYATLAPPDLWSRDQVTGRSRALQFADFGVPLLQVSNDRAAGWAAVDELLAVNGEGKARLHIFRCCRELIRTLPLLQIDPRKPDDVMTEPHDITHDPDSLRYFAVFHVHPARQEQEVPYRGKWSEDMLQDYGNADRAQRTQMLRLWGRPYK